MFFVEGQETYDNQMRFGKETFEELESISAEGYYFRAIIIALLLFAVVIGKLGLVWKV